MSNTTTALQIWVPGTPVPKGSAKAFIPRGWKRAIITQDNAAKQRPWASAITLAARDAGCEPMDGPIDVEILFRMPRLRSHFGSGANADRLRDNAPLYPVCKPDIDKLARCVLDALTGVCWRDDGQVTILTCRREYAIAPGAEITVTRTDAGGEGRA